MTHQTGTRTASAVEQLSTELSNLPVELVLRVFDQMLTKKRVGASHAPLSTVLQLTLGLEPDSIALLGAPRDLHDSVADVFADHGIRIQAQHAVLAVPMLTSKAVAEGLRSAGKNLREVASRLRRDSVLVGVPQPGNRSYVYPAFQIDPVAAQVHPVVSAVNSVLRAADDPWGVASWWVTRADGLDEGRAPMDLVGTDREDDLLVMVGALPPSAASDARQGVSASA